MGTFSALLVGTVELTEGRDCPGAGKVTLLESMVTSATRAKALPVNVAPFTIVWIDWPSGFRAWLRASYGRGSAHLPEDPPDSEGESRRRQAVGGS
jgi:hypothetical protein